LKKLDLGQTITILANVGVIAGIVFLAIELRQNNELLGVQIRSGILDRQTAAPDLILQNPELWPLLDKEEDSLTHPERQALLMLGTRMLYSYDAAFSEVVIMTRDETALRQRLRAAWRDPWQHRSVSIAWSGYKDRADPDFVTWMEQYIVGPASE